jgi:hypothetical protein
MANFAAVNAANLAIRPAHLFDVIQALIFGLELGGYVYQFHGLDLTDRIASEG